MCMFDFTHPSLCFSICKEEQKPLRKQLFKGIGDVKWSNYPLQMQFLGYRLMPR